MNKTIHSHKFPRGPKLLLLAALVLLAALGLAGGLHFQSVQAMSTVQRGLELFTTCNCSPVAQWPQLIVSLENASSVVLTANIAGGVADCYPLDDTETMCVGDGLGDNHNDGLPSTPKYHSAAVGGPLSSGNGSKGTARFHVEWDIASLASGVVESAEVLLHTHRGTIDSLDTFFYAVTVDGNGTLEDSDFQSAALRIVGARLPVTGDVCDVGTFTFDVTSQLQDALDSEHQFFSIQGRVEKQQVDIDIKPGSYPNCFNSDSHGVIPVAILGSADFDASTVDPFTVSLNGAGVRVKGKSGNAGSLEDVNGDGFQDLVVQIIDDGGYTSGDTIATLQGLTYDGQPIVGTDSICIRPPEKLVIDQENDPVATLSFGCGDTGLSRYQSFIPAASPLAGVELRLRVGASFPDEGVNTTINIRSGSPTGDVLATATAFVPGPQASMTQLLVHFGLSLTVTPGETLVIEWLSPLPLGQPAGTILSWMGATGNPYPDGTMFSCYGDPTPDYDLNFRTFTQ